MPIPITLTAHGQPAQVLTVPTSWADVTLATFVTLHAPEPGEQCTAAELLLGLPAGGLGQLAADDVPYLANLLEFANDPSPVLELLPTPGLPDVGTLPYGTLVMAQQHLLANAERPMLASAPYLLALYRVQLAYGKYDEAKVAACLAALLAAPVTECYGDLSHFLQACRTWQPGTRQARPTTLTPMTKNSTPTRTRRWLSALGLSSAWTWPPVAAS